MASGFPRSLRFFLIPMAVLAAAAFLYAGKYNSVINVGMKAPDFQNLPGIDGKNHSLSDYKQDVVVVVFLANHCPWVRGGDRDLIKLVSDFQGKSVGFVAIGVNLRKDDILPAMKEHAEKVGYNFDYLHDPTQAAGRKYGATHTPEFFVLNKDRRIVYTGLLTNSPALMERNGSARYVNGPPTQFYVRDAINDALAGKPVAVTETRAQGCTVEYTSD
jgi:peroxiredoxin